MRDAILASGAEIVTVALRRQSPAAGGGASVWGYIRSLGRTLLPNTAGCRTVREAVALALMAREIFEPDWLRREGVGGDDKLQADAMATLAAARARHAGGW